MILSFLFGIAFGIVLVLQGMTAVIETLIEKEYPGIVYDKNKKSITFYREMFDGKTIKEYLNS